MSNLTEMNSDLTKLFSIAFRDWTSGDLDLSTLESKYCADEVICRTPETEIREPRVKPRESYSDLYKKYLGTSKDAPFSTLVDDLDWIDVVKGTEIYDIIFAKEKIKIGYFPIVANDTPHKPYAYYDTINPFSSLEHDGKPVGFEFEMANILIDIISNHYEVKIIPEWNQISAELKGDPGDNELMFKALTKCLDTENTSFDVEGITSIDIAISGVIDHLMDGNKVTVTVPTLTFYTGIIYTGLNYKKYGDEFKDIAERAETLSDKDAYELLVEYLRKNEGIGIGGTSTPNFPEESAPSYESAIYLRRQATKDDPHDDTIKIYGLQVEEVMDEIESPKKCHFVVADGIVLANFSVENTNKHIINYPFSVRCKNMDAEELVDSSNVIPDTNSMMPFTSIK